MQILQGKVSNLTKETYNQDTGKIAQESQDCDDFYLMNRYEFTLNDTNFTCERYNEIENGDELIVCFDKKHDLIHNTTKNWQDSVENPIKKKDVIILAVFFVFGVVLAVSSNKTTLYMLLLLVGYGVGLFLAYLTYKDYKKDKFFIDKMQEMANSKKNS